MTAPAFLQDAAQDEADDLTAVGIQLTPPLDATAAALDAWASDLLRQLGDVEADRARYVEAWKAESARLAMRYEARIEACNRRADALTDAVKAIALTADFGSKKSRDVGYGTYGRRLIPEKVSVVDPSALLAFATQHAPELLRVVEKRDVPHAGVKDYVKQTGDVPPGVELEPAHDEPFAKAVHS